MKNYSDFVLGMFSNMVIESFLIDKRVLRVQIGQIGDGLLKFNEIDPSLVEKYGELFIELQQLLIKRNIYNS